MFDNQKMKKIPPKRAGFFSFEGWPVDAFYLSALRPFEGPQGPQAQGP